MVHNGVEYGIMQAYAEGFNILHEANAGAKYVAEGDAEVAPMDDPENYQYDIDTAEVAELWRRGSVVGSWLLDLTADVLRRDSELSKYDGGVSDSGEGRWTVHAAVDLGVPAPVISSALYEKIWQPPTRKVCQQSIKWYESYVWRSRCPLSHSLFLVLQGIYVSVSLSLHFMKLFEKGLLPEDFRVTGCSRRGITRDDWLKQLGEYPEEFLHMLDYMSADLGNAAQTDEHPNISRHHILLISST